jgi:Serine protease inhibitor
MQTYLRKTALAALLAIISAGFAPAQDDPGLKLFELLDGDKNANHVFSPYSAVTAMQMAQVGAAGATLEEFNSAMGALAGAPRALPKGRLGYTVANAAFYEKSAAFQPEYARRLKQFNAEAKPVDFVKNSAGALKTINSWVSANTRKKIQNLLTPDNINAATRIVLVNALHFKDGWAVKFTPENTRRKIFTTASGAEREVSMMNNTGSYNYAETDGAQALEMPYENGCVMTLYLPKRADDFAAALALLGKDMGKDFRSARVELSLPKFKVEKRSSLVEAFKQLGIREAFEDSADFSKIFSAGDVLSISEIVQSVFIEVDESGAEAAAATAVIGIRKIVGVSIDCIKFIADRPFLFKLSAPDGTPLFTGAIRAP